MERLSRSENGHSEVLEANGDVLLSCKPPFTSDLFTGPDRSLDKLPPLVEAKERQWIGTFKTSAVIVRSLHLPRNQKPQPHPLTLYSLLSLLLCQLSLLYSTRTGLVPT